NPNLVKPRVASRERRSKTKQSVSLSRPERNEDCKLSDKKPLARSIATGRYRTRPRLFRRARKGMENHECRISSSRLWQRRLGMDRSRTTALCKAAQSRHRD